MAVGPLTVRAFQSAAPPPADLDAVITRFVNTAKEYQRVFLDLVAEETKVAEVPCGWSHARRSASTGELWRLDTFIPVASSRR